MAHPLKTRNRPSSTSTPNDVQENLSDDVVDRLRHAQIVQLEGRVAELECTTMWVKTEGTQYGVTTGTMRSFRFEVNGISVVLYTPEIGIPSYSKVDLPLADGDSVQLAIASEALSGRHLVYGLRLPADPRVFVAFAAGSLEFAPDTQIYYLPRLPRFWGRGRWKRAARFVAAGVLAVCLFAYLAHGEPRENGLSATVVMNSIAVIACASYLLTITFDALRWRLNLPTDRQRNLLAVLSALGVPAQGPNKGTICAV